jgi:hypothetical protein
VEESMLKLQGIFVKKNKRGYFSFLALILISVTLLSCLISGVYGLSETATVGPYGDMIRTVTLNQGESLSGILTPTALGTQTTAGSLSVIGPDQSVLVNSAIEGDTQVPFSFAASVSGSYTIHFWSVNMLQSTRVTLDYTVQSAGVLNGDMTPIIIGLIIVVIILCLGTALILKFKSKKSIVSRNTIAAPLNQQVQTQSVNEQKQIPFSKTEIKCGECGTINDLDSIFCKKCANRFS